MPKENFVTLVREMRLAQKEYFRLIAIKAYTEAKQLLPECKELEKKVDQQLENFV